MRVEGQSPPRDAFRLRSSTYLVDRVKKCPAKPPAMELTAAGLSLAVPPNLQETPGTRVVRIDFTCPGDFVYSVEWRAAGNTSPLVARFVDGTDDPEADARFCADRLKIVPVCAEGPWLLRWAMGKPGMIARAATTTFRRPGPGTLVVTVDVAGSLLASKMFAKVTGQLTGLVVDLGFVVEARAEEELPEQLLGGVRISRFDLATALAELRQG